MRIRSLIGFLSLFSYGSNVEEGLTQKIGVGIRNNSILNGIIFPNRGFNGI